MAGNDGGIHLPTPAARVELNLAELIMKLGAGVDQFDEGFARDLARALHLQSGHLRLPSIDALGIEDVIVTLSMDKSMRLVVSGNLAEVNGFVSVRWDERDFMRVIVTLHPDEQPSPYTFATMDFSLRGRVGLLETAAPPLPAGQEVTVRALATVGGETEYRVTALGTEVTVPVDALTLLPPEA